MKMRSFVVFVFLIISTSAFAQDAVGFFTTPGSGHVPWIQAFASARQSIEMEMYHLTDPQCVNALIAAKKRGVNIAIILDGSSLKNPEYANPAKALQAAGIEIAASTPAFSITHVKAMVVDNSLAFVTSENLTTAAATQRDYGISTQDPGVISEFLKVFAADWQNAANKTGLTPQLSAPNLIWSPVDSEQRLVALINSAQKFLFATTENLGDPAIQNALAVAAKRGVDVRIIVPMCDLNPNPIFNFPYMKTLSTAGVQGHMMPYPSTAARPYMHGKMILVDGITTYIGSINFSVNSTQKARELGILFRNSQVNSAIEKNFVTDWNASVAMPASPPTNCPSVTQPNSPNYLY